MPMKSQKEALFTISLRFLNSIEANQFDRNQNGYTQWDIEDLDLLFDSATTRKTYKKNIVIRVWNTLKMFDNPLNSEAQAENEKLTNKIRAYCKKGNILGSIQREEEVAIPI